MRLLILGATGPTGRHLVRLADGMHEVTAFVRDPERAGFPSTIRIAKGDAGLPESVAAAVPGHDAVLSCIGPGLWKSFGPQGKPGAAAMRPLVDAMQRAGLRRLIALSAMGAGDRGAVSLAFRIPIATLLHGIYADKDAMERIVLSSPLDWTILRAANLNHGPEEPVDDAPRLPLRATASVSRVAVAAYMLRILEQSSTFGRIFYLTARTD